VRAQWPDSVICRELVIANLHHRFALASAGREIHRLPAGALTLSPMVRVLQKEKSPRGEDEEGQGHPVTPDLHLEVVNDKIIVTLPGTNYTVTYFKPASSPQLLARRMAEKDDSRTAMRLSEFLARAWKLANAKARELGWIV